MSANENEAEWVLLPDKSNAAVSCLILIANDEIFFIRIFNYILISSRT